MKKPGILLLVIISIIGGWAVVYRLFEGMKVTNLDSIYWGLWVSFYIYCIGLSAGSFLMSTLIYVFGMHQFEKMGRIALLSAVIALFAGLGFVWIDLGHPWRFYKIFTSWNHTSVLAWESMFYIFYIIAIFTELWFLMRCDLSLLRDRSSGIKKTIYKVLALGWNCPTTAHYYAVCHRRSMNWVRTIGILGIPVAIGVHGGTGALFAVVKAKPYWFSGLFPVIFLVSALVSGCGLMLMLYSWFGRRDSDYRDLVYGIRNFLVLFIGIDLLLFVSDMVVNFYGSVPEHHQLWVNIMFGEYWYVFWLGQITAAWLLPILLGSLKATRNSTAWLGFAGLLTVLGISCVRFNLVMPAYSVEQLPGLSEAFFGHVRLRYEYFPSLNEWLSSFGIFAILTLVFIYLWKLLPMYELEKPFLKGGQNGQEG